LAGVVGFVGLGKSVLQICLVLFAEGALAFAVEVQEIAQILGEVPDGVDSDFDSEVRGVGVGDRNLQNELPAAVQLAQECFAVEEPGIRKVLRGMAVHALRV
jgi:hypothetical protein